MVDPQAVNMSHLTYLNRIFVAESRRRTMLLLRHNIIYQPTCNGYLVCIATPVIVFAEHLNRIETEKSTELFYLEVGIIVCNIFVD